VNTSEKQAARTGALPVLTAVMAPDVPLEVVGEADTPTLTNEKRSRKFPSVRTDKSCSTNQIPILSSGSVSLNALAARLPIRFRVNIPWGAVLLTGTL